MELQSYEPNISSVSPEQVQEVFELLLDKLDKSPLTIEKYKSDGRMFVDFIKGHGFHENSLLDFKRFLARYVNYSVKTQNAKLIAARQILKELYSYNQITARYFDNVSGFKILKEHVKEGLTLREVKEVFKHISSIENKKQRLKYTAVFSLFVYQGLRAFEVVELKISNFKLKDKILFLKAKHRDDLVKIDLMPKTIEAVKNWLDFTKSKSGWLFPGRKSGAHLTKIAVQKRLTDPKYGIFKILGLEGKTTHGTRHFYITFLLMEGYDLPTTMRFARLQSLETVKTYDDRIKAKADLPKVYQTFNF